jgi:hypothetical protein
MGAILILLGKNDKKVEAKMQKVSIPYEVRDNQLYMQKAIWPNNCACCMDDNPETKYRLNFMAEKQELHTDVVHEKKGYPLAWGIPYCKDCIRHAEKKNLIFYSLIAIVAVLWVGLGYYLFAIGLSENPVAIAGYVVSLGILIYGSIHLNKLLKKLLVLPRLKESCASQEYAIGVTQQGQFIIFWFSNDTYAQLFLLANRVTN